MVTKPLEGIIKILANVPDLGTEPYIKLRSGMESFAQFYKESNIPGIYSSDVVKNAMLGIGPTTPKAAMTIGDFLGLSGQFETITGGLPKNWHEATTGDSVLNTIGTSNSLNTTLALGKSLSSLTAAIAKSPVFDIIGNKAISPIKIPSLVMAETLLNSIVNQSHYKRLELATVGSSILSGYQSVAILGSGITDSVSLGVSKFKQSGSANLIGFNWRDFGEQLNTTAGLISSAKNMFLEYTDGYSALLKFTDKMHIPITLTPFHQFCKM